MTDGFEAMQRARQRARPPFQVLDFADLPIAGQGKPADLIDTALRIRYRDADGETSNRWIKVLSVDPTGERFDAYCWMRRGPRSFVVSEISEIADINGECIPAKKVLEAFGLKKNRARARKDNQPPQTTAQPARLSPSRFPDSRERETPDWKKHLNDGLGKARHETKTSKAQEQKQGCGALVLLAILVALTVKWLW